MWDTETGTEKVQEGKAAGRTEEVKRLPSFRPPLLNIIVYGPIFIVSEDAYDDDILEDDHYNRKEKVVPKKVMYRTA